MWAGGGSWCVSSRLEERRCVTCQPLKNLHHTLFRLLLLLAQPMRAGSGASDAAVCRRSEAPKELSWVPVASCHAHRPYRGRGEALRNAAERRECQAASGMGFDGFEELSWVRRQQNDCERCQISEPEVQHDQVAGVARQQGAQSG